METIFLFCFVFGALFTIASAVLGFAGSVFTHLPGGHVHAGNGHELHAGHATHSHVHVSEAGHLHGNGAAHAHQLNAIREHAMAHTGEHAEQSTAPPFFSNLPLFNVSSLLAFMTAFGAAGFILMRFAGWSSLWATPVAIVPGVAADVLIAFVLAKILAGESVMRPVDYELEGTIGRVTVSIAAEGVGEIVFSKQGTRRSEAARSLKATAIPYNTEVVIVDYDHGTALVQPYDEFVARYEHELPPGEKSAPSGESER